MKILLFDNYDSFTYNLYQLLEQLTNAKIDVFRNDEITLEDIRRYDRIVISPGPGIPSESGILMPMLKEYASEKSILGVCLGEQAIGETFGARLINMKKVFHGVALPVRILNPDNVLFKGIPDGFQAGRYHSWIVSEEDFPDCLEITAKDEEGYIMALRHKTYDVCGVQFHPESVLTPEGRKILNNWLNK